MKRRSKRLRLEQLEDRTVPSAPGDIDWLRQFGSVSGASAQFGTVTVDLAGNVYLAGQAAGSIPGQTSAGDFDAFVRKYDAAGNELWTRQFGTVGRDSVRAIAVDALGVYVAGFVTFGALPGQTSAGAQDAFLRKYDTNGNELWTRQFGTATIDAANGVAVDASGIYVSGYTEGTLGGSASGVPNQFVRKYDANGTVVWTRQFNTSHNNEEPEERGARVSASESGVYVAWTSGAGGALARRYDANGIEIWTRQFGAIASASSVAADASGVYVAGGTGVGALPGQTNLGSSDAFIRRYDASGIEVWTRQFGTAAADGAFGVAVDAAGVYVVGGTAGVFPGQTSTPVGDAFVRKYDTSGTEVWTRQFGSAGGDSARSVAVDATGVYVAGSASGTLGQPGVESPNVFLRKYETEGTEAWTRQFRGFNPVTDMARAVDADGNAYVAGELGGALPGQTIPRPRHVVLRKYDAAGNELWTREFDTLVTSATGLAVDASGVYVTGFTVFGGSLPGQTGFGGADGFLRKYDGAGNELWTRQFGTSSTDQATGLTLDASGIYVTGFTGGAFPGQSSAGNEDAFLLKFDRDGSALWTRQFGTPSADRALGVAVDPAGVYLAGITSGALPGQTSTGGQDAFVRAYDFEGNVRWTRQFGNAGTDTATSIAADASGVYVAGSNFGILPGAGGSAGGQDAFVRKYDAGGAAIWTRQFGATGSDQANGIAVGATGVYVAGFVTGILPGKTSAGGQDAFVRKYDTDGVVTWTGQFGTAATDSAMGVNVGAAGLFVAGFTTGTFPGQTSAGLEDIFVAKVVDNVGNTAPSNVTLNLNASVNEGGTATVTGSFTDADAADTHTVVIDWGPGEGTTTLNLAAGVTTFSASHTYLDDNPPGTPFDVYTVSVTVTEPAGNIASGTTSITVNNVPPTAVDESTATSEGQIISVAVLANDSDVAGALDPLEIISVANGAKGTTTIDTKGTADTTDDEIVYTPNPGASGSDSFTYTISDGDGGTATATVSVQIRNLVDLSGRVFDDRDNDGAYEPGEGDVGLGDVAVQLFDETTDALITTQTTAADGTYFFDVNLATGTYKVVAAQPTGFLDGRETAGTLGGTVDNTQDSNQITGISVGEPGTTADAIDYLFAEILPSQALGLVWSDASNDGEVNFGERVIPGVTIELTGMDDRGQLVTRAVATDANGVYAFLDLRPSNSAGYTVREIQPAGYADGLDLLGTVNGVAVGGNPVDDTFSGVVLPRPNSLAENYNFGERLLVDGGVTAGQTATIGYWQNKNGQSLITSLNGGPTSTELGNWLAATFPNMYGASAGVNNLAGRTNADVAAFYKTLFARTARTAAGGGPAKMDAQVMATALAVYVTNQTLAGTTAAAYGFLVTANGVGTRTFNVGGHGAAFGVANESSVSVLDLLLAIDSRARNGLLYDLDGDGAANDPLETSYRTMANNAFSGINEAGDI